jgi:hypothetical protein
MRSGLRTPTRVKFEIPGPSMRRAVRWKAEMSESDDLSACRQGVKDSWRIMASSTRPHGGYSLNLKADQLLIVCALSYNLSAQHTSHSSLDFTIPAGSSQPQRLCLCARDHFTNKQCRTSYSPLKNPALWLPPGLGRVFSEKFFLGGRQR